jgi:hypothetical protein
MLIDLTADIIHFASSKVQQHFCADSTRGTDDLHISWVLALYLGRMRYPQYARLT